MSSTIMLRDAKHLPFGGVSAQTAHAPPTLHAMLASVGHEMQKDSHYEWNGLKRGRAEFAILQVTLDGEGHLNYEGRDYTLPPGRAMVLTVPHDHRYSLPPGGHWHFFHVTAYGSEVVRLWRHAIGNLGPVLDINFDSPFIQSAASLCARLVRGERLSTAQSSAEAYRLTMHLVDLASPSAQRRTEGRPDDIQRAIDFCREHLADDIGVADLAAAAGYSRYHFSRRFRSSEGCAPGDFLSRERIRLAVRLLQTTNASVKALAPECGFRDVSYFCRAFRKFTGMSPGSLRKSGMIGTP